MNTASENLQVVSDLLIPGTAGKPIVLDAHLQRTGRPKPVVIFSHGFKGFKDWGHFNLVADTFAANGFVFVKFNFSHNGTTPADPLNFGDLEAFGNNNYIKELDDLGAVIDWVERDKTLVAELDTQQVYLLGHSRGGAIGIIKASEDHRVKKVAAWASVSTLVNRNKKKTIETWKKDGVIYTTNARTNQEMPLYRQFYDVMMANKARLNVLASARRLKIPFLIVHGDADEAVPFTEAEALHKSARHSKLLRVEGGSHTFGGRHPHHGELPAHAARVVYDTIQFFRK